MDIARSARPPYYIAQDAPRTSSPPEAKTRNSLFRRTLASSLLRRRYGQDLGPRSRRCSPGCPHQCVCWPCSLDAGPPIAVRSETPPPAGLPAWLITRPLMYGLSNVGTRCLPHPRLSGIAHWTGTPLPDGAGRDCTLGLCCSITAQRPPWGRTLPLLRGRVAVKDPNVPSIGQPRTAVIPPRMDWSLLLVTEPPPLLHTQNYGISICMLTHSYTGLFLHKLPP